MIDIASACHNLRHHCFTSWKHHKHSLPHILSEHAVVRVCLYNCHDVCERELKRVCADVEVVLAMFSLSYS